MSERNTRTLGFGFDRSGVALRVCLALVFYLMPALASAQGPMVNGENHTAAISAAGEIDTWTFNASAGEYVVLTVAEVGGDSAFVPYVRLVSPAGTVLAHNWGALVGALARNLPDTGTYTVLVYSNDAGNDDTGNYVVRLAKAPGAFTVPSGDQGGAFVNGANHAGVIDRGDVDIWQFNASAGEYVFVSAAEVGADTAFVPYIALVSPAGTVLAHTWGALVGALARNLPATGTYTVLVYSNDAGNDDTGNYIARLAKAPGTPTIPPDDQGGAFVNGANHAGVIDRGDVDIWQFTASAGEYVFVSAAEVGADTAFVPYIALVSPAGTVLAHTWGALVGALARNLPDTGTYTVLVYSNDAGNDDAGNYIARLAKAPGTPTIPPDDQGGAFVNGANHAGVIDRGDVDIWQFTANAGEYLVVTAAEVGADTAFVPYIALVSPAGTVLAHNWGALVGALARNAPDTGTYTVLVYSNDAGNDNDGNYVARLAKAPSAFTVPAGDHGGPLTNGASHPGVIDRGDIDQWSFSATAGRNIVLTLAETGGDSAFVPYIALVGPSGRVFAHNWAAVTAILNLNAPETGNYRVIVYSNDAGNDDGGTYLLTAAGISPPILLNPNGDAAVDFGQYGLWMRYNHGGASARWEQLDVRDPSVMATGDIDGSGRTDLIATFPGVGVRVWKNNDEWVQLHPLDATEIATGDLDGNGRDEVILSFPGHGLWIWYNNASWSQLHGLQSAGLATGNVDGDAGGRADLIVSFTGYGVWRYMNNATWAALHPLNASAIKTGDLDGSGRDDIVLSFPGYGMWTYYNNTNWVSLHGLDTTVVTIGNLDGDTAGRRDVTLTFPGYGVWSWMNNVQWVFRHGVGAARMTTGDFDGNGRAELLLSFTGYGVWIWSNNSSWETLHPVNPDGFVTGRFDDN